MGGLGNQLFQYACAHAVASHHRTCLRMDLSFLEDIELRKNHASRDYALGAFLLPQAFATPSDMALFRKTSGIRRFFQKPYIIRESDRGFDPNLQKNTYKNTLLVGYWQSDKYFSDMEHDIRKLFTLNLPLSNDAKANAATILDCTAVSIHVRRVDYVTNPQITNHLGPLSPEYYERACDRIRKSVSNPIFFIFSDDPQWCMANIRPAANTRYLSPSLQSYEDLILMSLCKHHIIANSSYSWWGAWLNPHTSKIVIAPTPWYADGTQEGRFQIPVRWQRLQR